MAKTARAATSAAEPAPTAVPAAEPAPAPVPETSAAEPTPVAPDPFAAAFTEAVAAEVEAAAPKKPVPAPAPTAPAPKPDELPAGKPAAIPESPTPAGPDQQPHPGPREQPQPQPQNLPPQPQPQPQPQAYQAAPEPPLFNGEEVTQLQGFYTEWPDVARATETMIRGMLTQTARRMYQDMAASLAPYLQTIDTLADRSQLSELQNQVTDYDTVATQLTTWAAQQPTYLRSAYEHVIKSGTASEVVDLINRYKADTQSTQSAASVAGQPAPVASPAVAPSPAPAPAPVNPALAQAAARLAPVATKRTNVVAPPQDFDSAFAEFAKAS